MPTLSAGQQHFAVCQAPPPSNNLNLPGCVSSDGPAEVDGLALRSLQLCG